MAPLVIPDLPAGRYWITMYRDRQELSKIRMDTGTELKLNDRRGSRAVLSTLFPGLGQARDLQITSGIVPFLEVGFGLSQAIRYSSDVGTAEDQLSWLEANPPTDPNNQPEYDGAVAYAEDQKWLAERTRDNYAILTGYFYVGNILNAAARRGPLRFQLSGTKSVAVNYVPPSRPWVGVLSLLSPGLGQVRMGQETRGLIWSGVAFLVANGLVEAQREYDYRQTVVNETTLSAQQEADAGTITSATLSGVAEAESERDSAKGLRNGAAIAALAVWVLNIADAVFLSDLPPIPLKDGGIAGIPLRLEPTWVGEGPGLALSGSF